MIKETGLEGAYVVEPERFEDHRGFFSQSWSLKEIPGWEDVPLVESNLSLSRQAGTLRGMHYQAAPSGQAKLVRCTRGRVYDVIVDLRPDSPTFTRWYGVELSAENRLTLCVPAEFAHGFQTLEDDSEIFYVVSNYYAPDLGRGVRWDDPAFGIQWPHAARRIMTDRDRTYPDFGQGNIS